MKPHLPGRGKSKASRSRQKAGGVEGLEVDLSAAEAGGWEKVVLEESDFEFSPEELREFLAADLLESEADPGFRERLRLKLWEYVRAHYGAKSGGEDDT